MKLCLTIAALFVGAAVAEQTPMDKVVELINNLKKQVEADGSEEQASFDTYACWCEKTMERKASDISSAKELVSETEILIEKLKGEIASHGAEISQLNKDIADNKQAQKEADAVRTKEYNDYNDEKTESEQCIGALEAAVKALTGSGTKKGFLDTSTHKAMLLGVAADMRSVLRHSSFPRSVSAKDLDMVKNFVSKPEDFMAHSAGVSAAQVGQNPFGDYAPQSTQIQGILKGMYDAFTADLEKDNANEAESQKSFQALMATKAEELATLEATLDTQEASHAEKNKKLKESQVLKDDTVDQLNADEAFFADTKDACKTKATEWSTRTRLRTEELRGMAEAVKILSEGASTFESALNGKGPGKSSFLQLSSIKEHHASASGTPKAFAALKKLATQYKSIHLAKIAAMVQMGGHFDKVMGMIDDMIGLLRKEEAADIVHRDFCESMQNANSNELADLASAIKKMDEMLNRMNTAKGELETEIDEIKGAIGGTNSNIAELLGMRNSEVANFRQALKDDTDSVALLRQASASLSSFYERNKIPLALVKTKDSPAEYAEDPDKAPESASFSSSYGGRKGESGGILAILAMLTEDLEKEISEGKNDDADAQEKYLKQNGALQSTLDAQEQTKVNLELEKSALEDKILAGEEFKNGKTNDQTSEGQTGNAIATDCAWVKSHFESRRDKRKDEIQGLVDAKGFLAGGGEPI